MRATRFSLILALLAVGAVSLAAAEARKVTYEDDVLPIFRNNCLKCHNPDKLKGDLDLTSFNAALKGGGSGVDLNPGDPDGSQLYRSIMHTDEPNMPPNATLAEKEIATIRAWIEDGLLQGRGSTALASNKPTTNLALKAVSVGRPAGPPPMPGPLALEPFVRAAHGTPLPALAASPWAPVVALAGAKQIVLYNPSDFEFLGVLPFPDGFPYVVKFSRDGRLLLAGGGRGGQSGLVTVWDIATGERVITIGDQFDSVLAADLSPDRKWIALGGPDRVLKLYNTKDGALEHRIRKHTDWVTALEFSPDGKYLASGDRNGGLVLWEAETGGELFTLAGHKGAVTAITWRDDSEMFMSAGADGALKAWKASDGSALRSINAHPGGALAASFAADGRVVSSGRDNRIQVWDPTGKKLVAAAFKGELPNRATFTDDGKRIVGSDWRGRVLVWDAATGQQLGELEVNPPSLAERIRLGEQRVAALRIDLEHAKMDSAKQPTNTKPARDAQKKVEDLTADCAAAEKSLARWRAAAQAGHAKAGSGSVSMR